MKTHVVKCLPGFFEEIWRGEKPFEIRNNDRQYQPGDVLIQREFADDETPHFTGRVVVQKIGYGTTYKQDGKHVVFATQETARWDGTKMHSERPQ